MLLTIDAPLPVVGVVVVGAAAASTLTIAVACPLLSRHVVDAPTRRSSHSSPTPRGGGLGVVVGLMVGSLIAASKGTAVPGYLLVAILGIAAIGFADDIRSQSATLRIVLTVVCAAGVVLSLLQPVDVDASIRLIIAVVVVAGYTNAFNFMDGINGISSISAVVAGGWLAVLAIEHELGSAFFLAVSVIAASLAFLPWNFPNARVFLGDVGSYGIGFALIAIALICWRGGAPALVCAAPFLVYVADTTVAVIRRTVRRERWSEAHREHVYQRLFDGGMSHAAVSGLVGAFSMLSCLGTWLISRHSAKPTPSILLFYVILAGAYLLMPRMLNRGEERHA